MHEDYEYVKSLEKEVNELESEKADFLNIYDLLLEEYMSKDVTCSYLHSLSDLNAYAELQMLCSNNLIKEFVKLENHIESLELALQQYTMNDDETGLELREAWKLADSGLRIEVALGIYFCFVRDLQGNDLLTGNHGSDLYTISLQETTSSTLICFMAKASPTQAWINFVCCEMSKAKRSSFKSKAVPSSKGRLNLLHMDLCGPMRVASINGKKYILVIVDDYSRYTWTLFLRSKDETPEVLKDFLTMIQRNLQAQVISVRTDRGTEFLNKTLNAYFKEEGIEHQTSTPQTPKQNGVVERRNRTLVEAARTMLSASNCSITFGLKQLQLHAILRTDQSSYRLTER
ncbi:retrovirus-related pol polyprotein from transposon TNT 1-94 [Tanacetum coccineum]|uniref:Retrovirus-related pol polyprotein from transposon TNT 1-94 n=1 Tax=Tanacetum coccineum TaxID=301880 RepID=A0ABQ4XJS5_9ASTR